MYTHIFNDACDVYMYIKYMTENKYDIYNKEFIYIPHVYMMGGFVYSRYICICVFLTQLMGCILYAYMYIHIFILSYHILIE